MPVIQSGGALIHYSQSGAGPAVLFIQGVGVIGNGWMPQVETLRERFTVITIDNRGIGGSTFEGPLTIEAMAADAVAVADAAGVDTFHLVGHSMGGVIAQQVALTATGRVTTLTLLCTFLKGKQGTTVAPAMLLTAIRSRVGTRAMRRRAFAELVFPRRFLAMVDRERLYEELAVLFGHDLAESPPIVMKQLAAMGRFDASARLHSLAGVPTLVVAAAHDGIARPRYGRALASAIPGARFVEFPHAGHALPIQQAPQINALIEQHLSAIPS